MRQASSFHRSDQQGITRQLIESHGPIIPGPVLAKVMGFSTAQAFNQARRRGSLGIETFKISGRRGVFAYTADYLEWLARRGACE
jgi:hypothetical protein